MLLASTLFKALKTSAPEFSPPKQGPILCRPLKTQLPTFQDFLVYFQFPGLSLCPLSKEAISLSSALLGSLNVILISSSKSLTGQTRRESFSVQAVGQWM